MKGEKETLEKNASGKLRMRMLFAILCLAALSIVELYLMMNMPKGYLFLGVGGLAILCVVYLITDLLFRMQNEKEAAHEAAYETIYKAQKVSYVFMKQAFLDMEKILDKIKANSDVPADELIQAQKAVGKVIIQRNRENALSMIHSNENLMERTEAFEESLRELLQSMEKADEKVPSVSRQDVTEALDGVQDFMKNGLAEFSEQMEMRMHVLEDSLMQKLEEIYGMAVSNSQKWTERELAFSQPETTMPQPEITQPEAAAEIEAEADALQEGPEAAMPQLEITQPEAVAEIEAEADALRKEPEAAVPQPEIMQSEAVAEIEAEADALQEEPEAVNVAPKPEAAMPQPEIMQPEAVAEIKAEADMLQEEPKELIKGEAEAANAAPEPEASMQQPEIIQPEAVAEIEAEEDVLQEEPEGFIEREAEAVNAAPEPEIMQPEAALQSQPEEMVESGPSLELESEMTPEKIASLLEAADETEETEPSVEEKPAKPNYAEPGHVMTPEEIAALLDSI